jgi:flagellar biosynthetic protein FliR
MDFALWTTWMPTLVLVLARLSGVLLVAPAFAHVAVPPRLRVMIAIVMGLAVVGRVGEPVAAGSVLGLLIGIGCEVVVGLAVGYSARLAIAGIELAASHVGQQAGISLVEAFDPFSGEEYDTVRRLFELLAIVVFLAVGGHRMLIDGLLRTFDAVPLGGLLSCRSALGVVVSLVAASFVLALKAAAPVLLAMLLTTALLGLVQRSIPQMNILSIGLPVRVLAGMLAMAAALGVLTPLLDEYLTVAMRSLGALGQGGGLP